MRSRTRNFWVEHKSVAPSGVGELPLFYNDAWYVVQPINVGEGRVGQRTLRYDGGALGAIPNPQNRAEINAAEDLIAYLNYYGCSKTSLPVCKAFQVAYNQSGLPGSLTEDGEYGPNTERALQNTLDEAQNDAGAGPSQQAPANCFPEYGGVPSTPALDRPNAAPSTPATPATPVVAPSAAPTSKTPYYIVGGVAAAGIGLLGYAYWRKHKRSRH